MGIQIPFRRDHQGLQLVRENGRRGRGDNGIGPGSGSNHLQRVPLGRHRFRHGFEDYIRDGKGTAGVLGGYEFDSPGDGLDQGRVEQVEIGERAERGSYFRAYVGGEPLCLGGVRGLRSTTLT